MRTCFALFIYIFFCITCPNPMITLAAENTAFQCQPTPQDEMGPMYRANAPYRNKVGTGYLLFGKVQSARDCQPITAAKLEFWVVGPDGLYGDDWRASVLSGKKGQYYFQSHFPPQYGLGRPHIHIKATAEGYTTLVTQHYPLRGSAEAYLEINLEPEASNKSE